MRRRDANVSPTEARTTAMGSLTLDSSSKSSWGELAGLGPQQ